MTSGFIVDLVISISCFYDHTVLTGHIVQKIKMSEWVGHYAFAHGVGICPGQTVCGFISWEYVTFEQ